MGLSCSRGQRRRRNSQADHHQYNDQATNTSSSNLQSSTPRPHPLPLPLPPPSLAIIDPLPFHDHQTTTSTINTTSTTFETNGHVDFSSLVNMQSSSTSLPRSLPRPHAPYPTQQPNPIPSNHINLRNVDPPMIDGLAPFRPSQMSLSRPPFVRAKKINSNVNVHKDTIKFNRDPNYLDSFLLSFTFDALVDGRFVSVGFLILLKWSLISLIIYSKAHIFCCCCCCFPLIFFPLSLSFFLKKTTFGWII